MPGIALFFGDPDTVGVQLEEGKALFPAQGNDGVQVISHGGLAAGQLDIKGSAPLHQQVILLPDFRKAQVMGLLLPGGGKADGAF